MIWGLICDFIKLYYILYFVIILFGIFGVDYVIFMFVVLRMFRVGVLILLGVFGFVGGLKFGGFVMWFVEFIVVII